MSASEQAVKFFIDGLKQTITEQAERIKELEKIVHPTAADLDWPEDARFFAVDEDGTQMFYKTEPFPCPEDAPFMANAWDYKEPCRIHIREIRTPNWKETLIRRPE